MQHQKRKQWASDFEDLDEKKRRQWFEKKERKRKTNDNEDMKEGNYIKKMGIMGIICLVPDIIEYDSDKDA